MSIKLVAFDWNGTLIEDTEATLKANNSAFKTYGLNTISLKQYQDSFDIPLINYWKKLGFDKQTIDDYFKKVEKQYHKHYEKLEGKCSVRKGVRETLRWLQKSNIKASIYSNHTKSHINKQLTRLEIKKFINPIIARNLDDKSLHYKRGKGSKLHNYIKIKKLKNNEVLSIGDSEEEIEIAKEFGYYSIAITGGWNSISRLKKHHPDFLIHNMKDLIPIIKKLNKRSKGSSRT